jgi:hypothetical protein
MQPDHEFIGEMSALFAAFLPPDLASRFSCLLALKPSHWGKIDPWRVWQYAGTGSVSEWRGSAQELLSSSSFCGRTAAQVVVLRCGHDRSVIQRIPLQEALIGEAAVFEGFISVVPGRLGIAINHDGMLCVLSR